MSYYPILSAPGCSGWTTMFNFAPNNWEKSPRISRYLNVTWTDGESWQTRQLKQLGYGERMNVDAASLTGVVPDDCLPLLSLTETPPPPQRDRLSSVMTPSTTTPNWRASLGLQSASGTRTCYQGEVDPFPPTGSLLTFSYFLQPEAGIENYLLLLNIEDAPELRVSTLEVRNAAQPTILQASHEVRNNYVNIVPLDQEGLLPSDMPLLICRGMAGIPLYFSRSEDGQYLSMEHTHPPASSVLHGRRWEAQKLMKQVWFTKAEPV